MNESGEPLSAEKRLVTVLFADLVGSTDLSQELDLEDYAEVVLAYQERGRVVVQRHGGTIANYLGDGLLGQFGYPVAHEDDADRAVRAALSLCELVEQMRHEFGPGAQALAVRAAVHSGVNVVGRMGGDDRADLSLFGETANIAARVQGLAEPGQVLVTEEVTARLRHEVVLADHGDPFLRGVRRPIRVFAVMGPTGGRLRRALTPMVDREHELHELRGRLAASRDGAGGAVTVVGVAGVGKSRLLTALAGEVAPGQWLEARGSELYATSAFSVAVKLVEQVLGLQPASSAADRTHALEAFVAEHPLAGISTRMLAALLSGEAPPEPQSSESAFHSVVELVRHLVLTQVEVLHHAVLVVEDLHWVDPSSRAVIARLANAARMRPFLLVLTTRPDLVGSDAPDLAPADTLPLLPLADGDMERLVATAAGLPIDADTAAAIVQRADGIPLFAEELARAAGGSGQGEPLPATLQASLLAWLDRTPQLRHLVQLAAVVGTRVPWDVLSVADERTEDEVSDDLDELVVTDTMTRDADARCHVFRHALVRDAVYASLLRGDRRRAHRRVADALESLGVSLDRPAEMMAHHLAEAGDRAAAARRYAEAALSAARRGANGEAQPLCELGLELLAAEAPTLDRAGVELELTLTLGNVINAARGYGAPGQLELWERAEALCIQTDNRRERSSAMNGQAVAAMFGGDSGRTLREATRLIELGRSTDDRYALLRGCTTLGLQSVFMGDIRTALANALEGITLYRDGDYFDVTYGFGTDHGAVCHITAALASILSGRRTDAQRHASAAVDMAERLDSPISRCLALVFLGMVRLFDGSHEESLAAMEEAQKVAEAYGLPFFAHTAELLGAGAAAIGGDAAAEGVALPAAAALLETGGGLGSSAGWWATALTQEAAGHRAEARATAEAGLAAAAMSNERVLDSEFHRISVRNGLALGLVEPHAAGEQLTRAAADAAAQGMWLFAVRAQADAVALDPDDAGATDLLATYGNSVESRPADCNGD